MFDFGNANDAQRKAISTVDGPVLITAGPGTGKTYTLVQRAIYLIQKKGVKPEEIMIATFTEKAAKELVTRLTNELSKRSIPVNINEMYIGTFHSICLRILEDHLEFTRLKKNYRLLDSFDQQYMVLRHFRNFEEIRGLDRITISPNSRYKPSKWKQSGAICSKVNTLTEEMVDANALRFDRDPTVSVLGQVMQAYQKLLDDQNCIDFSNIQTECYRLFTGYPDILSEIREKIRYIMVDEYQDTNYIQEQLVFLLAGDHHNICVVGDDDQGLYRFRGATIRNILEFPRKFKEGECRQIHLVVNYRSESGIVDFYNRWMKSTSGWDFHFDWGKFRYDKTIVPAKKSTLQSPTVVKLSTRGNDQGWHLEILTFIRKLKSSGKIKDYNQLAFLFNSVRDSRVTKLADFLEENGINVYSPRSDMFFQRPEIRKIMGCLMMMFPEYVDGLVKRSYKFIGRKHYDYYYKCLDAANSLRTDPRCQELFAFIQRHMSIHATLQGTTDYAYSGLLYYLFRFYPFNKILDTDVSERHVDLRPSRNLAMFTRIIGKYEYLNDIEVLSGKYIRNNTEFLFNQYLKLLYDGGIAEYEDESEYAPRDCVSFMTIHQAKGMEFPVVFVGSLDNTPKEENHGIPEVVKEKYYHRLPFEPADKIGYYDFWRKFYTAFSRAQNLLVLTCQEDERTPSPCFEGVYRDLPGADALDLQEFTFKPVKDVDIKNTFSFTSDVMVYETCPLQYKFYKELQFMPVRQGAMIFGLLVHETIEDIHKAAIRGEEDKITYSNILMWFNRNYSSLNQSTHSYLDRKRLNAALKQVKSYANRYQGKWDTIRQAEVDVSLVQPDYIMDGRIDLVKGQGNTVELVDFKSEKKPDKASSDEELTRYRRQLQLYAYLVKQRYGLDVSRMHIYYTADESDNPMISFDYDGSKIQENVEAFDSTVHKILSKDFNHKAEDRRTCKNCDFRYYCGRV
jgi:DNA helicase-2/ATP-dependent DNA helicase PcrA